MEQIIKRKTSKRGKVFYTALLKDGMGFVILGRYKKKENAKKAIEHYIKRRGG